MSTRFLCATGAVALVGATVTGNTQAQLDTELTPVPKSTAGTQWAILGGAKFDRGGELFNGKASATPYTVDFFSVSFSPDDPATEEVDQSTGFFAGAECIDGEVAFGQVEDDECAGKPRRPAVYRYGLDELGQQRLERMSLVDEDAPPDQQKGYVAAVAWIDSKRALAVGGDRIYPRREPGPASGGDEPWYEDYRRKDLNEGAGRARAWLYEDSDGDGDSEWRELTKDGGFELPDGALTALDCSPLKRTSTSTAPPAPLRGHCVAGGMQRLWWWRPATEDRAEGFDTDPIAGSDVRPTTPSILASFVAPQDTTLPDFHYRVRDVQIDAAQWETTITAATSGCCGSPDANAGAAGVPGGARILRYRETDNKWTSQPMLTGAEAAAAHGAPLPDSYYSVYYRAESATTAVIASPGGDMHAVTGESGSRIFATSSDAGLGTLDPDLLDSLRLVAADGDYQRPGSVISSDSSPSPDAMFDWAVGSFKDTGMGAAYTTVPSIVSLPNPLSCPIGDLACASSATDYQPSSKRLLAMGTYALNALKFVPGTDGRLGWAAGDRGALARLGEAGRLGANGGEPDAPMLRPGQPVMLSDREPFEPFRAGSTGVQPGTVPPLVERPLDRLPKTSFVPWGSADTTLPFGATKATPYEEVTSMTMSRDGAEGWAIGSGGGTLDRFTLQHFDGERWSRCDPGGLGGVLEPDPACASLRPLVEDGRLRSLMAIARIPLERDDDPSNDDEFAAIAVGTPLNPNVLAEATVLIYQDGRWTIDRAASKVVNIDAEAQIAFRTPNDGWLAAGKGQHSILYHYSGDWPHGRWIGCGNSTSAADDVPECGEDISLVGTGGERFNEAEGIQPGGTALHVQVAGDTVFASGVRTSSSSSGSYPYVVSLPPAEAGAQRRWRQEYDPGCVRDQGSTACHVRRPEEGAGSNDQGVVYSLSVVDLGGGKVAGWVLGKFGSTYLVGDDSDDITRPALGPGRVLLRRDPEWESRCGQESLPRCGPWSFRDVDDAADELIPYASTLNCRSDLCSGGPKLVSFRDDAGGERSYLMPAYSGEAAYYPPLEYDASRDRWQVMPAPFGSSTNGLHAIEAATQGIVKAAAPDNRGGLWIAARSPGPPQGYASFGSWPATFFYRHADERHRPVFRDAPNPIREPITALSGTPDGDVWVTTESERVYHYDRIAGWERLRITGWDPGRIVTQPSRALAVAVNAAGVGIVVGERGRIVDVTPTKLFVDPATSRRCGDEPPPALGPCGRPHDLTAAAVAPDGSAMAGGKALTLVWRPAGGNFRVIDAPRVATSSRVTGIAMPVAGQAWITLDDGAIWRGVSGDGIWRWTRESTPAAARAETDVARLNALAVDADGRGLAVGMRGAMLERSEDGQWTRLDTGSLDHLYSVALPAGGYGDGTLVGGGMGVIYTRVNGRFRIARPADDFEPLTAEVVEGFSGRIVGLAVSGGGEDGQVEAWAASQVATDSVFNSRELPPFGLLHYGSGDDPILNPESRARPLPDTAPVETGEVTLAAFGRTECQLGLCGPFQGTNLFNEVITRRIQTELQQRRERDGEAVAALFTGDIGSGPGRSERNKRTLFGPTAFTPLDRNPSQNQWRDLVAEPLLQVGVPLFAVPGKTDLSRVRTCNNEDTCADTQDVAEPGVSLQWRRSFAGMPAPWGGGEPASLGGVEFRPVEQRGVGRVTEVEVPARPDLPAVDTRVPPSSPGLSRVREGGARTHYALDMVREDGTRLVRLVFIDNSFARSLAASEGSQNPVEGGGGQAAWLERMLCIRGETCAAAVSRGAREPGQPAVVVSNAPTYSYGPGALDGTQADGSTLETLLMRHRATAVVSGRVGWNGLFYTLAAGVHSPCPGGGYPQAPPKPAEAACSPPGTESAAPAPPAVPAGAQLADALRGLSPAPVPAQAEEALGAADGGTGKPIPNLIASTAGGRFGPRGGDDGTASQGFWHGYSVLRLRRDGGVIVEQRPIFDWIGIDASAHVLKAGQSMTLRGYGREPYGTDTSFRSDRIDSPAITHRYDLVEADPDKPYLPKQDADGEYVPLDPRVATVDSQTGKLKAGKGRQSRTYAIGILSVGDKAATWPLVFEPAKSFKPRPAASATIAPPGRTLPAPSRPPGLQVLGQPPAQVPPSAPPSEPIGSPTVDASLPAPPSLPSIGTGPAGVSPAPPPPPAPPAPPSTGEALPLSLEAPITPVSIVPTVIPPTPPPINPAPPGGSAARKEARQRQAATAKSEEGGDGQAKDAGVDLANEKHALPGAEMTRLDSQSHPFTAVARPQQPSAWARGALYGGGLALAALALGSGWLIGRPTPRHRPPELPAPAWARARNRPR